jgi:hypothetical protein
VNRSIFLVRRTVNDQQGFSVQHPPTLTARLANPLRFGLGVPPGTYIWWNGKNGVSWHGIMVCGPQNDLSMSEELRADLPPPLACQISRLPSLALSFSRSAAPPLPWLSLAF